MKVIWNKLDLKLWGNVSFKYFLLLEIQLYYQKNVLEWKISWVTNSDLGKVTIVSMTSLLEKRKDPIRNRRHLIAYRKVPTTPKS
jgi:hypothetical protein